MSKTNGQSNGANVETPETPDEGFQTPEEFDAALEDLLERGHRSGIAFDRSWTFRDSATTRPDLMVEISELARRPEVPDSEK